LVTVELFTFTGLQFVGLLKRDFRGRLLDKRTFKSVVQLTNSEQGK